MRRFVTAREQAEMLLPWREATPWHSKEGDPTYQVPTQDLLRHRQFNPAITTPQEMFHSQYTTNWGVPKPGEPTHTRSDPMTGFMSGGGSEGSQNDESLVDAFESGQAHKLPPVEVTTNGNGALLTDGNHRAEVADMMSHPELSSYIHYDPHEPDDMFNEKVDPNSGLGKHIDNLVQNHPYEPVDGGPTTDAVFKKHPETGRWQRGIVDHREGPQFVDTPEYAKGMQQHVPGYKHDGLGTYFPVDWGNGNELTHERHLHARFERVAFNWKAKDGGDSYHAPLENGHSLWAYDTGRGWAAHIEHGPNMEDGNVTSVKGPGTGPGMAAFYHPDAQSAMKNTEDTYKQIFPMGRS